MYTDFVTLHGDRFVAPRQLEGLETAWLCYPITIRPDAGFERAELQQFLDERGVDTRTVWTGNVTRQPMMRGVRHRTPPGGLPCADRIMAGGMILPCSHALDDDDVGYVLAQLQSFLDRGG
jgi:CDP-6-deoxy-D-xylo-4-hexulose-3-dehydrase